MSATQQTPNLGLPKLKGSDTTSWLGDFNGAMDILDRLINIVYPVGSYYETNDASFNPNTAWKGTTWVEDTSGTVLVSRTEAGTFTSVGATGGEEKHTLTENELAKVSGSIKFHGSETPSIVHQITGFITAGDGGYYSSGYRTPSDLALKNASYSYSMLNFAFGNNEPHNNMPPYTVVKRWRRTA